MAGNLPLLRMSLTLSNTIALTWEGSLSRFLLPIAPLVFLRTLNAVSIHPTCKSASSIWGLGRGWTRFGYWLWRASKSCPTSTNAQTWCFWDWCVRSKRWTLSFPRRLVDLPAQSWMLGYRAIAHGIFQSFPASLSQKKSSRAGLRKTISRNTLIPETQRMFHLHSGATLYRATVASRSLSYRSEPSKGKGQLHGQRFTSCFAIQEIPTKPKENTRQSG